MAEAQIWQWPINTLNPVNTNMYMFMVTQDLPGRGKRELRAAVAEKDIALAENDVTVRARQVVNEIKQGSCGPARDGGPATPHPMGLVR